MWRRITVSLFIVVLSDAFSLHPWLFNVLQPTYHETDCVHSGNKSEHHLSPIDIQVKKTHSIDLPLLSFSSSHWNSKNFYILNNTGKLADFTLSPPMKSMTLTGGPLNSVYKLDSFHAHWHHRSNLYGTEHSFDQRRYAMEFHAVYFNKNYFTIEKAKGKPDGLAVVAFIVETAPGDHYNREFEYLSLAASKVEKPYSLALIRHNVLLPFKRLAMSEKYYHYKGTVTGETTEPVMWILFKDTIRVNPNQVEPFRKLRNAKGGHILNIRETSCKRGRIVYSIDNSIYENLGKV